ncbi:hypothetical protein FB645_002025 [Coemansia sp. IMI 203386]|nr:hypothetical protein FB645_002025 [Coemansia sp. IMI 203386]
MPVFGKLPSIVQTRVLDFAISDCRQFSEKLTILSVCSDWRKAALPVVYRTAHAKGTRTVNRANTVPRYSVVWSTNIDLLETTGSTDGVRSMVIEVQRDHMLLELKNTLYKTLMFGERKWPNIRRLCIVTDLHNVSLSDNSADSDDEDVTDTINQVLNQAADALIEYLPGVVEVRFSTKGCGLRHMCFCGHLANGYANQLAKVIDSTWVFFTLAQSLEFLTVLDLDLSISFEPLFPRINPEKLRVLRLNNCPPFFSWRIFDKPSDPGDPIIFGSLTTLGFHMNQHVLFENLSDFEEEHEFKGQVVFPKLHTLCMKGWPRQGAHFDNCVFPQQMHRITCLGSTNALAEIARLQHIRITGCLEITSAASDYAKHDFFGVMKQYAAGNLEVGPKRIELVLESIADELEPDLLSWVALTRLELLSAEFDRVLVWLKHLPRLDCLGVSDVYFGRHWENSCGNSQMFEQVSSSRLTVLRIDRMIDGARGLCALGCVEQMLRKLEYAAAFHTLDNISSRPVQFQINKESPYMVLKPNQLDIV